MLYRLAGNIPVCNQKTGCMDRYVAYTGWAATLCDLQRLGKFVSYIDWQAAGLSLTCTHRSFLGQSLFADVVHKIKTGLQRTFLCRPVLRTIFYFLTYMVAFWLPPGLATLFSPRPEISFFSGLTGCFSFPDYEQPFSSHAHNNGFRRVWERRFFSLRPAGTLHKTIFLLNIRSGGLFSRP